MNSSGSTVPVIIMLACCVALMIGLAYVGNEIRIYVAQSRTGKKYGVEGIRAVNTACRHSRANTGRA